MGDQMRPPGCRSRKIDRAFASPRPAPHPMMEMVKKHAPHRQNAEAATAANRTW
jgi:hypothetical protein